MGVRFDEFSVQRLDFHLIQTAVLQESSELTKGLHGKLGGLLQKAEDSGRDPQNATVVFYFFCPRTGHTVGFWCDLVRVRIRNGQNLKVINNDVIIK